MDHGRHVELGHLLVERIPPLVGHRRRIPGAARRIGIEVAADEAVFVDAALELADAALRIDAGRLRQLAYADEVLRIERADAMDQLVADLRPLQAQPGVTDVMRHAGGARREDRQAGAALALQLELRALHARADLVVADLERGARRFLRRVLDAGDLGLAEIVQLLRFGRVVAVTVDDHDASRDEPRSGNSLQVYQTRLPGATAENPVASRQSRNMVGAGFCLATASFRGPPWPICRV